MLSHARIELSHIFLDIVIFVLSIFYRYDLISFNVIQVFSQSGSTPIAFFSNYKRDFTSLLFFHIYTSDLHSTADTIW